MDFEINEIADSISKIYIDERIIKIQSWFRGCFFRLKRLPNVMYKMKEYLKSESIYFSSDHKDGRINSCIDEEKVIDLLFKNFGKRIRIPRSRMWYDILILDYIYGWIPVNIKITTMTTCDNTGNLAMCVYSYTDEILDIHRDKSYDNGNMSSILINKLKDKKYNTNAKKDYYFLVLNKKTKDIIVNSVKGLTILTSNINNLPFQVNWSKNRVFKYENITKKVKLFIDCLKKPKPSWKESFMHGVRKLD